MGIGPKILGLDVEPETDESKLKKFTVDFPEFALTNDVKPNINSLLGYLLSRKQRTKPRTTKNRVARLTAKHSRVYNRQHNVHK